MFRHPGAIQPLYPKPAAAVLVGCFLLWVSLATSDAQVQSAIVPDGTLGTLVTPDGRVFNITGGTRPDQGPNLFHSFSQFDVGTGDEAHFMGQPGIDNIIGRVTGGSESLLDGRLQADANLFLLNPSGFMFGPNAALDVNGSFHASTADALRFADGAAFSAHLNEKSTLTVAAPAAFGFLSEHPAGITVAGSQLQVPDGTSLSLIGGNLRIVGDSSPSSTAASNLSAAGGRITLVSVASSGEVRFDPTRQAPDPNMHAFDRLGEIEIRQDALIDTSGESGGTVVIRGGRLLVAQSSLRAHTLGDIDGAEVGLDIDVSGGVVITQESRLTTESYGAGDAGDIRITAQSVQVEDHAVMASGTFADGDTGVIRVQAQRLAVHSEAIIGSRAFDHSGGNAGKISIEASQVQLARDGSIQINLSSRSRGSAEDIVITADIVALDGGALLSGTDGNQDASDIEIRADRLTMTGGALIGSLTSGASSGHAGDAVIKVGILDIHGAQITTGTADNSRGDAGSIRIQATENVTLAGASSTARANVLSSFTAGDGNAGDIDIEAQRLTLANGAQIASFTDGGSSGDGGVIRISAIESITITGRPSDASRSGLFNFTEGRGDAGGIEVRAGRLILADGATIDSSVRTGSDGTAGSVTIQVDMLELNGTQIISGTRQGSRGRAGTVRVTATDSIIITGVTSTGTSSGLFSNTESSGDAGVVEVQTRRLVLSDGGQIASIAFRGSSGQGGTVRVNVTDSLTITGSSGQEPIRGREFASGLLTSTAGSGDAGTIEVSAGRLIITNGGQIGSNTTQESRGQGGTVRITTRHGITMSGSQSTVAAQAEGTGSGGDIILQAPTIALHEGAFISAESLRGNAGDIHISASTLSLQDDSSITARSAQRSGGNIEVQAQTVHMIDSEITTTVLGGEGSGGNIAIGGAIDANGDILAGSDMFALEGSRISANTDAGDGANIAIGAQPVRLDSSSEIAANTNAGTGGNVALAGTAAADGRALSGAGTIVLRASQISANAQKGKGGRIDIVTEVFLADPTSTVDASSQAGGIDGVVNVEAVVSNLSEIATPLSPGFAPAAELLRDRCAAQLQAGMVSSLVARGRISVPATPEGLLPGRLYQPSPTFARPPELERQPGKTAALTQGRPQIMHGPFPAHAPVALMCHGTKP